MITYERIYPPSSYDKYNPDCPDCGDKMFYVGLTSELSKWGGILESKLYQCGDCRRLYKEVDK